MKAGKSLPLNASESDMEKDLSPAEARRRQRVLGRRLRQLFDDVTQEPVPDELMDLLDQIDEKSNQSEPSND